MKSVFTLKMDPNRVFGLDILRALAILFVAVEHAGFSLPTDLRKINNVFVLDGVSIFFVLSGFLIGGILIRTIEKNGMSTSVLFNFWKRRWFRTLPNYFFILIILFLLHLCFTEGFTFGHASNYFIFSQNLFQPHPEFFPEAWSLSVEEWFYLLIPVLIGVFLIVLKTTPKQSVLITSVVVIIAITLIRYYRHLTLPIENTKDWDLLFRKEVITRLDSLMFGVVGAYISFYYQELWLKYKKPLLYFGIVLFIVCKASKYMIGKWIAVDGVYYSVFSFSLISIATLSLLPYLSSLKNGKGFFYKPITYISLISYSMYLLNFSLIQVWIIDQIHWDLLISNTPVIVLLKYSLYWVLLFTLSILLYKYFESPMTRLREKQGAKESL